MTPHNLASKVTTFHTLNFYLAELCHVANFSEFKLLTVATETVTREMLGHVRALKSITAERVTSCRLHYVCMRPLQERDVSQELSFMKPTDCHQDLNKQTSACHSLCKIADGEAQIAHNWSLASILVLFNVHLNIVCPNLVVI